MLFYFHPGDLGAPFILFLFFIAIVIALLILAAFVWVLYIALHKPKNKETDLAILIEKKMEIHQHHTIKTLPYFPMFCVFAALSLYFCFKYFIKN